MTSRYFWVKDLPSINPSAFEHHFMASSQFLNVLIVQTINIWIYSGFCWPSCCKRPAIDWSLDLGVFIAEVDERHASIVHLSSLKQDFNYVRPKTVNKGCVRDL